MRHKLFVVSVFIVLISSTIGGMVASKVLTNEQAMTRADEGFYSGTGHR